MDSVRSQWVRSAAATGLRQPLNLRRPGYSPETTRTDCQGCTADCYPSLETRPTRLCHRDQLIPEFLSALVGQTGQLDA